MSIRLRIHPIFLTPICWLTSHNRGPVLAQLKSQLMVAGTLTMLALLPLSALSHQVLLESEQFADLGGWLAGLSFNIMPCVLPVIPLIMAKLMSQSREKAGRRIGLGMAFCGGVILFFAVFAAAAIAIKAATGAAFNWGDQLRYPAFVLGMGLFLVAFGLFMFDVFGISIPSSIAGGGAGGGMFGSIGMGFFAALLSTPCSGAILAAVLVWAQTQNAAMSIAAFLLMGVGMAAPYAAIVFVPGLLAAPCTHPTRNPA